MRRRKSPVAFSGAAKVMARPIACDEANNSAAPNAPMGVQRPTIIAARPMKPRPAVIPAWNDLVSSIDRYGAAERGDCAGCDHVAIAQADDVDADRLGGTWVLADGARAQAPRVRKSRICVTITRMIAVIAIGPWLKMALISQPMNGMLGDDCGNWSG